METKYDVIILGGGPAGLTAAIYCTRYGLKTILISREIGGTAKLAHKIENYPGYEGPGLELMKKFQSQAEKHGTDFLDSDIIELRKEKKNFIVTTSHKKYSVKALILALGTQRRKLNIPGEDKFLGKGVSYCATCDGAFFKNKDVAVIGGGDSACKAVLLLSDIAKRVYFILRGEKETCEHALRKNLSKKNIIPFYNTIPLEIKGKEQVSELVVEMGGKKLPKEEAIKVDGVFIEVGSLPISDIARMLKIRVDKEGYIVVDGEMKTNVPGICAAGDIVKSKLKQVIVSASQGAISAKSIQEYLQEK
jgi:thioredoxin reductase (NADPH)